MDPVFQDLLDKYGCVVTAKIMHRGNLKRISAAKHMIPYDEPKTSVWALQLVESYLPVGK